MNGCADVSWAQVHMSERPQLWRRLGPFELLRHAGGYGAGAKHQSRRLPVVPGLD